MAFLQDSQTSWCQVSRNKHSKNVQNLNEKYKVLLRDTKEYLKIVKMYIFLKLTIKTSAILMKITSIFFNLKKLI